MGIDIGTQSIRVRLYDEDFACVGKYSANQYIETPKPMWATSSSSNWWNSVKAGIKQVVEESKVNPVDIVSIGVDAIMHGCVPVKLSGEALQDQVQIYSDKRGEYIADLLSKSENSENNYKKTANVPVPSWFGIKIKWIKDNEPEIYNDCDKFLTPKDFINFRLTGKTCIDLSEATGSYLMDKNTMSWSDELILSVGVDLEKLPTIHKAYEKIGNVKEDIANELGLSTSTLVICGAGDMMASLYPSGLSEKGNVVDLSGTGSLLTGYVEDPILDPRVMNLHHALDGWVPFGVLDSSGGTYRWVRDTIGKDEAKIAIEKGMNEYNYLDGLARDVNPGSNGLIFLPYMMGERTMGSSYSRGSFIGLNLGTTIGHMVRAVLEGISFEHKRTLDIFESRGAEISCVYHTGGGAKSELWNQIKADIYQKPVYTLEVDEGGVLGSALLGGVAAGLYESPEAVAKKVIKVKKIYEPNKLNKKVYDELYKIFCDTHDLLQDTFVNLAMATKKDE